MEIFTGMLPALLFFISINLFTVNGNTLSVILDAKWENTPLIAEASEYFMSESRELFWKFVSELNKVREKLSIDNNELVNHEIVTKIAKQLINSGQLSILQLSLSMRLYSAAVEMNHQLDTDLNCSDSLIAAKVADRIFCNIDRLVAFIVSVKNSSFSGYGLYKTDKIYPIVDSISDMDISIPKIIIYGDLRDQSFYDWYNAIFKFAETHTAYLIFRHRIKHRYGKTRLTGYGVELAIKSTEYKAVDDEKIGSGTAAQDKNEQKKSQTMQRDSSSQYDDVQGFIFSKLKELHPNSSNDLDAFKQHLLKSDSEIRPLKAWQIQELSLKAGQFVMNSLENNEALETLRDISQNYPVRAHYLSEVPVSQEFKNELTINQAILEQTYGLQPGQSLVTFNGYMLSQDLDIYEILDLARREMGVMQRLHSFGLQGDQISSIMNVQHSEGDPNAGAQFLLDIRNAPIVFINNLEKDSRYNSWPKSVRDLLTPTYPGVMRRIARNFFNTILVLDPAIPESREYVKFVEAFIIHNAPIRMGFLWAVDPTKTLENAPGRALIRAFNFVWGERDDPMAALSFMTDFYSTLDDNEQITVDSVKDFLKEKHPDLDLELTFGDKSDYDNNIKASWKYLQESGLVSQPKPFILLNGLLVDSKSLNEMGFEETVVNNVLLTTMELQKLVVSQQLRDGISALDVLLSAENVVNRLNDKILKSKNSRFISFTASSDKASNVDKSYLSGLSNDEISTNIADTLQYFVKDDDFSNEKAVTVWVVTDVDTSSGQRIFFESLRWTQSSPNIRVGLIQNPFNNNLHGFMNRVLYNIIKKLTIEEGRKMIIDILSDAGSVDFKEKIVAYLKNNEVVKTKLGDFLDVSEGYLARDAILVKNILKVNPGETAIVANGKIIGPFDDSESLIKDDFKLIERSCSGGEKLLQRLKKVLGSGVIKSKRLSDLTNKIHATLRMDLAKSSNSAQIGVMSTSKKIDITGLKEVYTSFSLMGHLSKPAFDLVAVIDPLSRAAQKLSHIMLVLKDALNLNVRVIFNCKDKLSEQPLKSFYRFVLEPYPLTRDEDGNPVAVASPKAKFSRLPGQPLLTLGLEPIHNWLIEPIKSVYDLDNLKFDDIKDGLAHAQFELEYLLLEGHCVDLTTGQPPRGLQFVLTGSDAMKTTHDTIVMANLGYFQLKANPGAWHLTLRVGKSKEIYDITDHEYTDNDINSPDVIAVLDSFRAKIIRVKVTKKPNKLSENLLSESKLDEDTRSIWSSISNAFSKSISTTNETINIFSVASGHLYERFLRIMMISVIKQTKSKVKFWFLKNYLSPTFKQFIPYMAEKYGFEYDLVQYKWPRWLHQQTEKQRIIWGYKILFLDVLFPLNVSKIIFVDADQMVRADLKELVDLDLEGAPYGYTPFCESRKEMDGFRFWKTGYWSQHLAGRPYHISALYVVDLKRFRQMAAGDRLRGQYHGLSQDPNSLSNLDQDLPNNMIHQVPIKSLPQEWLWCETWCADSEKARAKTIDLCNNPMTKEPKLSAAMRILPEWKDYDGEIKELWNKVYLPVSPSDGAGTMTTTDETSQSNIPVEQKKTEL